MPDISFASAAILAITGLIYVFSGYRLLKFLLTLAGLIVFGGAIFLVLKHFYPEFFWVRIIASVFAGVIGAWLFHAIMKIAIFLTCMSIGFLIAPAIMSFLSLQEYWQQGLIVFISGLILGFIGLSMKRFFLILITTLFGASLTATCSILLYSGKAFFTISDIKIQEPNTVIIWSIISSILLISGVIVQLKQKES